MFTSLLGDFSTPIINFSAPVSAKFAFENANPEPEREQVPVFPNDQEEGKEPEFGEF